MEYRVLARYPGAIIFDADGHEITAVADDYPKLLPREKTVQATVTAVHKGYKNPKTDAPLSIDDRVSLYIRFGASVKVEKVGAQ